MTHRKAFAFLAVALACVAVLCKAVPATAAPKNLILATTTSTQDSGLLDVLVPAFEKQTGYWSRRSPSAPARR